MDTQKTKKKLFQDGWKTEYGKWYVECGKNFYLWTNIFTYNIYFNKYRSNFTTNI